jgi:hypothetical protein
MMRCWHGIPPTRWRRAHRTNVWIVSDYYLRFLSEDLEVYYPGIRKYFADLLDERTGYAIADDAATPALPWWIYPQYIDALGNRITILQRSPSP